MKNDDPSIEPASSGAALSLREQHHAVTRQTILRAARELFAERGFSQVSVKAISERAGVAIQTIYATFGSKAGVVSALVDLIDRQVGVVEATRDLARCDDPREALRIFARLHRQVRETCGDLVRIIRSGAAVDPDVAAVWAEGIKRRHQGLDDLAATLGAKGALREGLTSGRAADIAAALVAEDVCDVLVDQRGWTFDEYETWLSDSLVALLLR